MTLSDESKGFYKSLSILTIPIIFQEFINSAVNIMDVFMVGHLGVAQITAVGLANQIFFLFILLVFGVNSGASIFMGQFWGKQDIPNIHKTMGICMISSFCGALLFFTGARFFPEQLMSIYSKDAKVIELGADYLRVISYSYLITSITFSFGTALRCVRQTRLPMLATVTALICNTIFNYIFIFIFEYGVVGSALGTVIARVFECILMISAVYFFKMPVAGRLKSFFSFDFTYVKNFYQTAIFVILNEFIWALGVSAYNIAYKFTGTEAQGAIQIASTIQSLFLVISMGMGSGSGIMLANALGANEFEKARLYSRKFMKLIPSISFVMGMLLILSSHFILSFFNVDVLVKQYARNIMIVIGFAMILKSFNYTTIVGILRSGGDTKFCLFLDFAGVWFIGVPIAFLTALVFKLPIYWIFALVQLEEVFKAVFSTRRVLSNIWIKNIVNES